MDVGAVLEAQKRSRIVTIHPETMEQGVLDDFVYELSETRAATGLLIDEMLYLSKGNGQAGPGVMGWLTRGRARKQSFIGATQRPANITQYAYTEADYLMIYTLKLKADWRKITELTERPDLQQERPKYRFGWYDVGEDKKTEFGPIPYEHTRRRFAASS